MKPVICLFLFTYLFFLCPMGSNAQEISRITEIPTIFIQDLNLTKGFTVTLDSTIHGSNYVGTIAYLVDGTLYTEETIKDLHLMPWQIERIKVLKLPKDISGIVIITTARKNRR